MTLKLQCSSVHSEQDLSPIMQLLSGIHFTDLRSLSIHNQFKKQQKTYPFLWPFHIYIYRLCKCFVHKCGGQLHIRGFIIIISYYFFFFLLLLLCLQIGHNSAQWLKHPVDHPGRCPWILMDRHDCSNISNLCLQTASLLFKQWCSQSKSESAQMIHKENKFQWWIKSLQHIADSRQLCKHALDKLQLLERHETCVSRCLSQLVRKPTTTTTDVFVLAICQTTMSKLGIFRRLTTLSLLSPKSGPDSAEN